MNVGALMANVTVAKGGAVMAPSVTVENIDEHAFHALYQQVAPKLRSYIRRVCGEGELADDILQETFLRFLRANLSQLEPHQMRTYLYKTAMSLLVDHWRKLKREARWNLMSRFREERAPAPDTSGDVMSLFKTLKLQEQTLLWLAYVEGLDHREIAAALTIKEKSVRVLLFRARKKIAGMLTEKGFGPEGAL